MPRVDRRACMRSFSEVKVNRTYLKYAHVFVNVNSHQGNYTYLDDFARLCPGPFLCDAVCDAAAVSGRRTLLTIGCSMRQLV